MSPERGGLRKSRRTTSGAPSSCTASGEGAVPPPASGAVPESSSGPGRAAVVRRGGSGSPARPPPAASRPARARAPPPPASSAGAGAAAHLLGAGDMARQRIRSIWRSRRRSLANTRISSNPNAKPPMWAKYATPPPCPVGCSRSKYANTACCRIQIRGKDRRELEDREEEDDEDDGHDPRLREQQEVAAEDARDRARGAQRGDVLAARSGMVGMMCAASAARPAAGRRR